MGKNGLKINLAKSLGMERDTSKEDTGIEGLSETEYKLIKKAWHSAKALKREKAANSERISPTWPPRSG